MNKELEVKFSDNCLLCGLVETVDDSFDHAFGTKKSSHYEVKEFNVIVYIKGQDYDITKSLTDEQLENFKNEFLDHVADREWEVSSRVSFD